MSFIREMANVSVQLGSVLAVDKGITYALKPGLIRGTARGVAGITTGYFANTLISDKSPEEIKEKIRNRAVDMLVKRGITLEEANQSFDQHYAAEPLKKSGFWRNLGNQISTDFMAGAGILAASAIAGALKMPMLDKQTYAVDTSGIAKKAVVVFGALGGGYIGNKAWQGPSSKAIDERSMDIVTKILMERKPAGGEISQVEALQMRDQQRAGIEVGRQ